MADPKAFKWYVVNTYSGYEKKAKQSLQKRIESESLHEFFGDLEEDILIPAEEIVEVRKGGEKKSTERKLYPGYMFIKMNMTDESWHLVKATPKITGFVGNQNRPAPVPLRQIIEIKKMLEEGSQQPKSLIHFDMGEEVKVIDGPFMNFNGTVEEVNPDKAKVRVMVSIFGRSTPVELDFSQVEKL